MKYAINIIHGVGMAIIDTYTREEAEAMIQEMKKCVDTGEYYPISSKVHLYFPRGTTFAIVGPFDNE